MLCLNISGAIIRTCTRACFGPIKSAKERRETKPLPYVDALYGRILVRDGANAGWTSYMLKDRQKSEFDGFLDCIIIESLHNPIADA